MTRDSGLQISRHRPQLVPPNIRKIVAIAIAAVAAIIVANLDGVCHRWRGEEDFHVATPDEGMHATVNVWRRSTRPAS